MFQRVSVASLFFTGQLKNPLAAPRLRLCVFGSNSDRARQSVNPSDSTSRRKFHPQALHSLGRSLLYLPGWRLNDPACLNRGSNSATGQPTAWPHQRVATIFEADPQIRPGTPGIISAVTRYSRFLAINRWLAQIYFATGMPKWRLVAKNVWVINVIAAGQPLVRTSTGCLLTAQHGPLNAFLGLLATLGGRASWGGDRRQAPGILSLYADAPGFISIRAPS
jgi:hypothetical protein